MKKLLTFSLCFILNNNISYTQSNPSFDETMTWIKNKLEIVWNEYGIGAGSSANTYYPSFTYTDISSSESKTPPPNPKDLKILGTVRNYSCTYQFKTKSTDKNQDGYTINNTFKLRDINRVEIGSSGNKIILYTYNSKNLITSRDNKSEKTFYQNSVEIPFDNSIAPERMKKAFENAAMSCGGMRQEAY